MPLYTLVCLDRPDFLDLRMGTREDHLAYVRTFGDRIKLGGPFLTEAGQMAGSLIIFEAETLAEAEAFSLADPYRKAGLFQSVDIRQFRPVAGALG